MCRWHTMRTAPVYWSHPRNITFNSEKRQTKCGERMHKCCTLWRVEWQQLVIASSFLFCCCCLSLLEFFYLLHFDWGQFVWSKALRTCLLSYRSCETIDDSVTSTRPYCLLFVLDHNIIGIYNTYTTYLDWVWEHDAGAFEWADKHRVFFLFLIDKWLEFILIKTELKVKAGNLTCMLALCRKSWDVLCAHTAGPINIYIWSAGGEREKDGGPLAILDSGHAFRRWVAAKHSLGRIYSLFLLLLLVVDRIGKQRCFS